MQAKKLLLVFLTGIALTSASLNFFFPPKIPSPLILFPGGNSFEKEWKRVDSLANQGLSRSAIEMVEAILKKAKQENNSGQVAKALIHKIKFESYIQEDDYIKSIYGLKLEVDSSLFPLKNVLQSMLAEVYWGFYQQNRWRFLNRTETVGFKNEDIRTWDMKKILAETINNYTSSLHNSDSLKRTPVSLFEPVLIREKESVKYRPTLYDFLAHRAIDFFIHDETGLTQPAYKFELDKAVYFSPAPEFARLKIVSRDTFSLKFQAIILLQNLIGIHQEDTDPSALIDADLKRLKFLKNNSPSYLQDSDGSEISKDSLYLTGLKYLEKKFSALSSNSEINFEIANLYFEKGSSFKPREEDVPSPLGKCADGFKTAHEICKSAIQKFPESSGAKNCKYLLSRIEEKSISFNTENINPPDHPFLALVKYKNVRKIYFRVAAADFDSYKTLIRKKYGKELVNAVRSLKTIKEWSVDLPDEGDYQSHSTEIKIPGLPLGHYVILCGTNDKFDYSENGVAYAACWVSNLSYVTRVNSSDGSYDVRVFNRNSGEPLKGAIAKLFYQKYNYVTRDYEDRSIGEFTSDQNGYFNVPPSDDYRNFYIDFNFSSDRLNTNSYLYQYKPSPPEKKRIVTYFFTDRGIYRPGQTIYFKGIIIETDGEKNEIKPGFSTTVIFNDVNYQKVGELKLTTNEFGSISGTFTAPQGILNGQMHITDQHGFAYFSVEEYKRPKFEVNFEKVKGSYKLGEKVLVKGAAKTYSGSSIDDSEVKFRVVRSANFPYSFSYGRGGYPNSPEMEISNGTAKTNEKGEFEISFIAIPDKKVSKKFQPVFHYTVSADVTDAAGETHSATQNVIAGYSALSLSIDVSDRINKTERDTFLVRTTNLAGEDEPSKGTLVIYKLKNPGRSFRKRLWESPDKFILGKEEFYNEFPLDFYDDENNYSTWEKSAPEIFSCEFNTEKSKKITLLNLASWTQGVYVMEAKTQDKYGEEVKEKNFFTLFSPLETAVPSNEIGWFAPLQILGEPGENAGFIIGSWEKGVKVLFEIEHRGKIVSSEWISLNSEQKKIEIPIEEKHRGNFSAHFLFVKNGRVYNYDQIITVPHSDKMLGLEFETFRNKLFPGQKEEWKIKIKNPLLPFKGEKPEQAQKPDMVAAEMVASMYDASLDAFRPNNWIFNVLSNNYSTLMRQTNHSFTFLNTQSYFEKWNNYSPFFTRHYDRLNWFDFYFSNTYYEADYFDDGLENNNVDNGGVRNKYRTRATGASAKMNPARMLKNEGNAIHVETAGESTDAAMEMEEKPSFGFLGDKTISGGETGKTMEHGSIKVRSNFAETAFFYPHLLTNEKGEIFISFTVPEALTKWKFSALSHTKDLNSAIAIREVITQKELMVTANAPRFLREGDKINFTAKVSNLSESDLIGESELFLFDAITLKDITSILMEGKSGRINFSSKKGQSSPLSWNLSIPDTYQAITYKVVAKALNYSDGEEMTLPVLTNRMLVTESMPLPVKGRQKKDFRFEKLIASWGSSTLKNHKLTLEFTANPAWYAVQALPYLMEYPYECSEQTFNRFYANSIASHVAGSSPKIKAVFDSWKSQNPDALLSNLEKNQELKSMMLAETPWVLDAKNESEKKNRISLLFDLNKMSNELDAAIKKLKKNQTPNGGWSWFPGMPDNRYITQYIVAGFGHLDKLGVKELKSEGKEWEMVSKAVPYLDDRMREDYERLKKQKTDLAKNNLGYDEIQYLYSRSYFFNRIEISSRNKEAFNYYKGQAQKFWLENNRYLQGMLALALHRFKDEKIPPAIIRSLKENAIFNEELGMYWKEFSGGLYWYQAPIEAQSLFIEAFNEISNDKNSVNEMRIWLLKNKQTNDWKTTKATADACYALLLNGTDWLSTESSVEITLGEIKIDPKKTDNVKAEAGTGYFKTSWAGNEIKPEMGKVSITKNDEGVSWGALYWQYFEQLDKITPHETPLKLNKKLFLEKMSDTGPVMIPADEKTILKPGDKIKVRIELRVDRDMEFVQMKDMRGSCLEPENVISQYKWQDGLGYYESTGDAATNFFFDYLLKGVYVFEYPLRITHQGNFSNGITTIQCMYAPEFASHSEGVRVKVGN